MPSLLRVEFHCHTYFSKDSLTRPADLLAACVARGIHRIVITDHNTIQGALEAQKLDPHRVIVGEEILTQEGELLAAYVTEEIPKGLPALEAIQRLRDQGAFISVSHPFDRTRSGHWQLEHLEGIAPLVDAVEVYNSRCLLPKYNALTAAFARQHGLAGTVGSDAHTLPEIGRAVLHLPPFEGAQGLKEAMPHARVEVCPSGLRARLGSRYAVFRKRLGWKP